MITERNTTPDTYACDGDTDLKLRHERELSSLNTITHALSEQNNVIADSLKSFNESITDLKIIISQQQESIKGFMEVKEELGEFNNTVIGLKGAIKDLQSDLKDRDTEIKSLQGSTSHLTWLNNGIKRVADNIGVVFVMSIIALFILEHDALIRILKDLLSMTN